MALRGTSATTGDATRTAKAKESIVMKLQRTSVYKHIAPLNTQYLS
jgi:hypothetical protein